MDPQEKRLLHEFSSNVPGAVFYYTVSPDGEESIEFLNNYCEQIWGIPSGEIESSPNKLWEFIHTDDVEMLRASVQKSAKSLSHWDQSWRWNHKSGIQKWLHGKGQPIALPDKSIRWMTFIFEITARVESEAKAAMAQDQLTVAMEAIPDGFAIFDEAERFVACNNMFRSFHHHIASSLTVSTPYEDILWAGANAGMFRMPGGKLADWVGVQLDRYRSAKGVVETEMSDGKWLRVLERATIDGGRIIFHIDITASKLRQKELEKAALTDSLTGLFNRRGLTEKLSNLSSWLEPDERLALLHLDLDKFKTVHDAMGHEAGDHVLTEVSRALLQNTDARAAIARVGGDEFLVALPMKLTNDDVMRTAENLREYVTKPILFDGRLCQVGATIGVSFWNPGSSETFGQALLDADTALMQGKSFGRNRSIVFTPAMRFRAVEVAQIASQIKEGLQKGQFIPYFQPQIAWPSGQLHGLEILVRWQKPDGTILPASTFVNVANETGLIVDIDNQMFLSGLDAFVKLRESGMERTNFSFNFSGAQLSEPNLVERVVQIIENRRIPADLVVIEILESTLLDHRSGTVAENIHALADAGFRVELDDFGTGHTALASIRHFPVNGIKIDRSLIRSIDIDPSLQAITEGIFNLCQRLGIDVIAEGVETNAELNTLTKIGLSVFQGYVFAKPMPYENLSTLLLKNGNLNSGFEMRKSG